MQIKKGVTPTARDGGNLSLIMCFQIIFMWVANDIFNLGMSLEVAAAFSGLTSYIAARYLRY